MAHGFSRIAGKVGLAGGDKDSKEAPKFDDADSKDGPHRPLGTAESAEVHPDDTKAKTIANDLKDSKDSKDGEKDNAQRSRTPPPSYDAAVQQQQLHPPPQQPQHQQQQQQQQWQQQQYHGIARQFPPAFNIYSYSFSRTLMLGEHENQPLYAMRLHSGFSSSAPVVLHNGPDPDRCGVLATVEMAAFSPDYTITLPPPPGGGGGGNGAPSVLEVTANLGFTSRAYRFSIEVGAGPPGTQRMESFEWRHSYGAAVESLGGSYDGWKLVRLSRAPLPGAAAGGSPPGPFATTRDGFEVVAAWTDAVMSLTKRAKFAFVGTGNTGLLGERWAVAAVASALGIWEKERRRKRRRNNA